MFLRASKRRNIIDFFLDIKEAQAYVATHMFGEALENSNGGDDSIMNDSIELHDIMNDTYKRNML